MNCEQRPTSRCALSSCADPANPCGMGAIRRRAQRGGRAVGLAERVGWTRLEDREVSKLGLKTCCGGASIRADIRSALEARKRTQLLGTHQLSRRLLDA